MMSFLLQSGEMTARELRESQANLVFCGVFLLAAIGVAVWWLRKG